MQRVQVDVLTDSGGDFSTSVRLNGDFLHLRYIVDGSNPLATGWDLTITGQTSGIVYFNGTNLGTSSFTKQVRHPIHDETGTAVTYEDSGSNTVPVYDTPYIDEAVDIVVAQGGNANEGEIALIIA